MAVDAAVGLATGRVLLIRYAVEGQVFVGSGLRVRDRFVLTADHCAQGTDHVVEFLAESRFAATVHVRSESTDVDLAVLVLADAPPLLGGLGPARVDRTVADQVTGRQALGVWGTPQPDVRTGRPERQVGTTMLG